MAAELSATLKRELQMPITQEYFWSDSTVVLGYITNESKRFHIFVANRVQRIKHITSSDQWNYINTRENPADIASRGSCLQNLLTTSWLNGPEFLWQTDIDNYLKTGRDIDLQLDDEDPEIRKIKTYQTSTNTGMLIDNRSKRFSKYRVRAHDVTLKSVDNVSAWSRLSMKYCHICSLITSV